MSKYVSVILFLLFVTVNSLTSSNEIDSLKNILKNLQVERDRSVTADVQKKIGTLYFQKREYASALEHFNTGLKILLYNDSNIPSQIAPFHLKLGQTYAQLNDYSNALKNYDLAINIGKHDPSMNEVVAYSWRGMGDVYLYVGDYERAYNCHSEAMKADNSDASLGHSYYSIGTIFFHQKHWEKTLHYYKKSLAIWTEKQNESWIYTCNDGIGIVYGKIDNYEKWLEHSRLALKAAKEGKYAFGIAYGAHNLASYYLETCHTDKALALYREALVKMLENSDLQGQVKVLRYMGKAYIEQQKYEEAKRVLKEALELAFSADLHSLIAESYKLLYEAYYHLSELPLAYEYQSKYLILQDSLTKASNTKNIVSMQIRDELAKEELALTELQQKQTIKQLYPKVVWAGIFVLLLLALLLYNRHNLLQIEHQLLARKNAQAERERSVLATSNRSLDYFATMASNDLQKPLQRIDELASNLKVSHRNELTKDTEEFMGYVFDGINQMNSLLTDLLSYAKLDSRNKAWKLTKVNLPKLVGEVKRSLINVIEEKNAKIVVEHLPKEIIANQTTLMQLFQNLISNALKFVGDKPPIIRINCVVKEDEYIFSVQDNGIGIASENQQRIFQIFQRLHTSDEYQGTGIGLATCQKIVKRHGGEIKLTSELGYGTTFFFSISRKLQISPASQYLVVKKAA